MVMGVLEPLTLVGAARMGQRRHWAPGQREWRTQVRKTWIGNDASPLGLAIEFHLSDLGELPTFESFFFFFICKRRRTRASLQGFYYKD